MLIWLAAREQPPPGPAGQGGGHIAASDRRENS